VVGRVWREVVWFWLLMLLNVTIGGMTPPFGYALFAFKGVAPDTDLRTIIASTYPFIALFIIAMAIIYRAPRKMGLDRRGRI
jgi:TRAP-type C4-dicarboxylate transport system permease large subunit